MRGFCALPLPYEPAHNHYLHRSHSPVAIGYSNCTLPAGHGHQHNDTRRYVHSHRLACRRCNHRCRECLQAPARKYRTPRRRAPVELPRSIRSLVGDTLLNHPRNTYNNSNLHAPLLPQRARRTHAQTSWHRLHNLVADVPYSGNDRNPADVQMDALRREIFATQRTQKLGGTHSYRKIQSLAQRCLQIQKSHHRINRGTLYPVVGAVRIHGPQFSPRIQRKGTYHSSRVAPRSFT